MARRKPDDPAQQAKQTAVRKSLVTIQETAGRTDELTPYLRQQQVRKALADGLVPACPPLWWAETLAAVQAERF